MTTIETKKARLNELQAEIKNITDELLGDENISDSRDAYLRSLRTDARREMEALKAAIDAETPVVIATTFKNDRVSVTLDGAKVSLDKATQILFESELAKGGDNVVLVNENGDTCKLDSDICYLGKFHAKTAIRQFARGEKVTGAKVLNGKFYPVIKAETKTATVEETAEYQPQCTWVDAHDYETVGNLNGESRAYNLTADEYANIILNVTAEEYAVNADALQIAINAEIGNANFASGNYFIIINDEYVFFENHSIVRIDAGRKLGMEYSRINGKKYFRLVSVRTGSGIGYDGYSAPIAAKKIAERYMAKEAAKEQGKKFAAFFAPYKTSCAHEFTVMVYLTYVDGREHIFSGEFNQYRQAQQFISDVKAFAGDTPCQFFTKTRDHSKDSKPVWEDPHNYETVGCLDHARNLYTDDANDEPAPATEIVETANVENTDADYMHATEIVILCKRREAAKAALEETKDLYKGASELGNTDLFEKLGTERRELNKAIIACTKRLRELGAIPEPKAPAPAPDFDDDPTEPTPEPEPETPKPPTRREELEAEKRVIMAELDEYREGLLDAEADPDIPQSHIDFLNDSIERLLNEYYHICQQLDELNDEPKPAPVKLPSELPPVDTETITVATVQDARNIISQRFSGNFVPGEVCECWDGTTTAVYSNGEHRLETFSVDGTVINFAVKNIGDPRPFLQIDIDATLPAPAVNDPIVGTEITTAFESDYGYQTYDVNGETAKFYYGESSTPVTMLIEAPQYGAQLYRNRDGNIEFLARPNRSDNGYTGEERLLDADEFFKVMAERGACTIDQPQSPKPDSPCAIAAGLNNVFQDIVRKVTYMELTTQDGAKIVTNFGAAFIEPDWRTADGYVFGNHYNDVLARYETPQQVIDVMTALRDAIKAYATEFTFPPANEIQPPEETAREKFLKANAQIKTEPGRLLDNGNFGIKWIVRDEHGNRKRVSKATAAAVLNAFGLTPATYLDEKEKWVADEIARAGLDIAAADFAASVIAPAKVLALPVPVEPAAVEDERDVFSLLPKLEDLNDVDDECDEDAAEYTDRDDRYNRGEKIAEALTAKLRTVDPTVEVTFDIDDDEDTYYLSYDGIIRTPFTATGVEASFHAMKQAEAEIEADPWFKARRLESRLAECKSAELKARQNLNDACDRYDALRDDGYTESDDGLAAAEREMAITYERWAEAKHSMSDAERDLAEYVHTHTATPEPAPVDDFAAKLAAFDAEIAQAETVRDAAKAAYEQANTNAQNAIAARWKFLESIAGDLTRKLHETCIDNEFIETTTTSGCTFTIGDFSNIYIDPTISGKFVFVTWNNRMLARYDTPAQVETVIAQIKDTIDRREVVFTFPVVDELERDRERKAKLEDSLTRAMKTALDLYKGFCYTGNLIKAEYELKLYNICRKAKSTL